MLADIKRNTAIWCFNCNYLTSKTKFSCLYWKFGNCSL